MTRRRLRRLVTLTATLALAVCAVWLREESQRSGGGAAHDRGSSRPPAATKTWTELKHAALVDDPANDGDSFLISHDGGRHVMRLYFVDCPEKKRHHLNRDRLAEQGAAFGGLAEADTLRIGRAARDFTLELLRDRPFRVFTRWEPVFDERRHYAHLMVTQPDGNERDLAECLVDAGLARIHTKGADRPDGTPRSANEHHLRSLEKSARLGGRGGWAQAAAQNASRGR